MSDYYVDPKTGKSVFVSGKANTPLSAYDVAMISITPKALIDITIADIKPMIDSIKGFYKDPLVIGKGAEGLIVSAYCPDFDFINLKSGDLFSNKLAKAKNLAKTKKLTKTTYEPKKPNVAIKLALPIRIEEDQEEQSTKNDPVSKIVNNLKLKKKEKQTQKKKYKGINQAIERFSRSINIQMLVYGRMMEKPGIIKFGRVPKVFRREPSPKLHYVMEYFEGPRLLEYCKSHESDIKILNVFASIITFIKLCFHSANIIHTDIKVENIIMHGDLPIIHDFGAAKDLDEVEQLTDENTIVATQRVTTRTQREKSMDRSFYEDIFQLGILFWVMWARKYPVYPPNWRDLETIEVYDPSILPAEFRKFFVKAVNQDHESHRYNDIVDLIQGFKESYSDYRQKGGSVIINETNTTTINQKSSWGDWEPIARDAIDGEPFEDSAIDIMKALELLS